MARVLLLATMNTKSREASFLIDRLQEVGLCAKIIDISLDSGGQTLDGEQKCLAMARAAKNAIDEINHYHDSTLVIGMGGGTGGGIILEAMQGLAINFPKILITTLPFDPRPALADNWIIIVPTLADVIGLNPLLRDVLENVAMMALGLCQKKQTYLEQNLAPNVAITALGATEEAVKLLIADFENQGIESTVFHANGFGGAAMAKFACQNAFDAIIDLTPHEVTRFHINGAHVPMQNRFQAGPDIPRVVLPGALNFIGLGELSLIPASYLDRPHYAHSSHFTHVKLSADEMHYVSKQLAYELNKLTGPCEVLIPMAGFSHHDCKGGIIEDPSLREICAQTFEAQLNPNIPVKRLKGHISSPEVKREILQSLSRMPLRKEFKCLI